MWQVEGQTVANAPVTNLLQMVMLLNSDESVVREVHLEATVCAQSDPTLGVVILQDSTATELFQFSGGLPGLLPGDKVGINRRNCWLRRRDMGVQISAPPTVDNNGIHSKSTARGGIGLEKGRHSITIEWFNRTHPPGLEVKWQPPGSEFGDLPAATLFCLVPDRSGITNIQQGLLAEDYEGDWEEVPNFDLLESVNMAVVTNYDFRSREEMVGARYRGFFEIAGDGFYGFGTRFGRGKPIVH